MGFSKSQTELNEDQTNSENLRLDRVEQNSEKSRWEYPARNHRAMKLKIRIELNSINPAIRDQMTENG